MNDDTPALRRTALYDEHLALGARIVPFGGFEMPVQYAGILKEHEAVRKRAGLFDLSHMAQFELRGEGVGDWADRLTINRVETIKPLQARYNVFTNEQGGAHDDVIFYRLPDRWLLVVNASNAEKMWNHLQRERTDGIDLRSLHGEHALIAIQGPRSVEVLQPYLDGVALDPMKYYTCALARLAGTTTEVVVARTGYTGEDGFEVFLPSEAAPGLWNALLAENRELLEPCGLGARDVLRLEAGMPLYGHELTEEITPLQAGLGWAVKFDKPAFRGRDALAAQRDEGKFSRIAGIMMDGRVPARAGYAVFRGDERIGEIRSGSTAPALDRAIATALIAADAATPGQRLEVEIRGSRHGAEVVAMPFYKRPR